MLISQENEVVKLLEVLADIPIDFSSKIASVNPDFWEWKDPKDDQPIVTWSDTHYITVGHIRKARQLLIELGIRKK